MDSNELIQKIFEDAGLPLRLVKCEDHGDVLRVYAESTRDEIGCPDCNKMSGRRHSKYWKKFRDLPMSGKKVEIWIHNRVMFCDNPECERKTFAEMFEGLEPYARKTNRLWTAIMKCALNSSGEEASKTLRETGIADVSRCSICAYEKKNSVGGQEHDRGSGD